MDDIFQYGLYVYIIKSDNVVIFPASAVIGDKMIKIKVIIVLSCLTLMFSSCSKQAKKKVSAYSNRNFAVTPIEPSNKRYVGIDETYRGYQQPERLLAEKSSGFTNGSLPQVDVRAYGANGAPMANLSAINFKGNGGKLFPAKEMIYGGLNRPLEDIQEYKFGRNDQMNLSVAGHKEFSGKMQVLHDGTVELPLIKKKIPALNQTKKQLKSAIKKELSQYLRTEPEIQLGIDFSAGQYYYIFGEVNEAGRYPMGVEPVTVSEAVFRANSSIQSDTGKNSAVIISNRTEIGVEERLKTELDTSPRYQFKLSDKADYRKVYVITPHRSRPTREIINVKEILLEGKTGNDRVVRPGQIIFVPSANDTRFVRFVERVLRPITSAQDMDSKITEVYKRLKIR